MKNLCLSLLLSIFFILFNLTSSSAQKNFSEGYVITLKQDTIKGKIDNREWNINPSSINFEDATGKKSLYRPNDIRGFFIPPKDYYMSFHVSLDLTSFQTQDLVGKKEQRSIKDTAIFLMVLVKGKASLYYLNDENNREHFYLSIDKGQPVELLLKKNYVVSSEGNTPNQNYVATTELFKGQLIVLLSDCPEMKNSINISSYSKVSIRKLVIKYNECQHSQNEFIRKEESIKIKFGLLAGPSLTKIYYGAGFEDGSYDLSNLKMKDCYSFLAGISFHLIFPRQRAQWSLVNEIVYKPYSSTGYTSGLTEDYVDYQRWFTFKMTYIKLYSMIRYQYPNWKIRPFAELGISNGYAVNVETREISIKTYNFNSWNDTGPAIQSPRRYQIGAIGGIGISIWKISGEFRYEWSQGLSSSEIGGPENTILFVMSFLL